MININLTMGGVFRFLSNISGSLFVLNLILVLSTPDFEILTLKIDKPHFKKFFVSVVYKPPKGDSTKCFNFISSILALHPKCKFWILGDFNIDFLKRNVAQQKGF